MKTSPKAALVDQVAHHNHIPADEAQRLCNDAWQTLATDARVTEYLSLFVEKRVNASLKQHKAEYEGSPH